MITYLMYKEFVKSGEFDVKKNKYNSLEVLFRLPFLLILDIILLTILIKLI